MRKLRIVTYNVHKCRGMDGRVRPDRIADVVRELKPDIVALQEVLSVDNGRQEENQASYLAEHLEMHKALGENRRLKGGAYGNVVLSRFPLRSHCNYDLSVPGRENRGCLRTDVDLPDSNVLHIFNMHLGTAFMERRHQARMLLEKELIRSKEIEGPRVVLGDFNEWTRGLVSNVLAAEFESADIRTLMRRKRTYPGFLPFMHLDHIYYDSTLQVECVALHRTLKALVASDHLPLVADFALRLKG
jgi:endonuclease/exonuclease/phosphatase family metal-dependent hydrolase